MPNSGLSRFASSDTRKPRETTSNSKHMSDLTAVFTESCQSLDTSGRDCVPSNTFPSSKHVVGLILPFLPEGLKPSCRRRRPASTPARGCSDSSLAQACVRRRPGNPILGQVVGSAAPTDSPLRFCGIFDHVRWAVHIPAPIRRHATDGMWDFFSVSGSAPCNGLDTKY